MSGSGDKSQQPQGARRDVSQGCCWKEILRRGSDGITGWVGGRSPKPLPTPLSTFSLLSNMARPWLLGRRSPARVGLPPPPLQGRPRAWGAEVDRREQGVPARVPILTFDKGRLGGPGWLTRTGWLILCRCHVNRFPCTTPRPGQEGSVLLPIFLMKKMSFRELKERVHGHTPVRVEEPA